MSAQTGWTLNEESQTQITRDHQAALIRIAENAGAVRHEDAEDVVQATLLWLWEKHQGKQVTLWWLCELVKNRARNTWNRDLRKHTFGPEELKEEQISRLPSALRQVEAREELAKIPPDVQETMLARAEGKSWAELPRRSRTRFDAYKKRRNLETSD